ncbi:glutamine-hydrolyzing GMP synthase [Infirmifilum sp. SLHALR2]|nr:MAG: GMP synthase (glutamine-hydrolyzing) [Thermofilum sp. NZ13]
MESRRSVLVFDFGGQYTHLIARRVRELNFYSVLVPHSVSLEEFLRLNPTAVIFSGGPSSIYVENSPKPEVEVFNYIVRSRIPLLGICYGHQLIASLLGGRVSRKEKAEYGLSVLRVLRDDPLFSGTPETQVVWMSHRDAVDWLPEEFVTLASTEYSEVAAFRHRSLPIYGVQFHPEVRHTEYGRAILENFLKRVAGLEPNWFVEDVAAEVISRLKKELRGKALTAVSGGVDSLTAAVMVQKAVGSDNIYVIHVNTGLLREGESERTLEVLRRMGFKNLFYVDASSLFLDRLRGVTDPEEKRRVVAKTFADVFAEKALELNREVGGFRYLVQGTIYPDRVESGATGKATAKIKSHHNVVMEAIPGLEIVEPLAEFYKDEVRRIARSLGLPEEVITQHPFPGPGLAVRIVGEVTEEKLRILRKATGIVEEEFRKAGLYEKVWQAFPVLLSVKTVGVKGDERSYEYALALRVVESEDAMTASFAKLPWDFLERLAERLVNEVEGVNRVLYDVTHKPPATIEFE